MTTVSEIDSKKINVLAISYGRNLFLSSNAERQRMLLCAQEVQSYHMVVFTSRRDGLQVLKEGGLMLYPTNSRSRFLMPFDAYRLGKQIVNANSGEWVVTAQDPFEAGLVGWLIARKNNIALNLQEHADYFSTQHWRQDSFMNRLRYYLGRFLLKRADSVRVVSKRIENTICALGVSSERVITLPVRSDQVGVTLAQNSERILRQQYPNALIVLTMARLVRQKNLSLLIRAFTTLAKQKPEALLVIIGKGDQELLLKNLTRELKLVDRVVFLPWTDRPDALLREADIYALSSNWEGWARVLIEAMAAGVPVVTTDVGCAGEVLLDGQHGYVVPLGDEQLFAKRLIELADDTAKRIAYGRAAVAAVATLHTTLKAYAKAWAEVLISTAELRNK